MRKILHWQKPEITYCIGRDIITRNERMRAFEPYGEYHDRRAGRALIIGGAALAATALAESAGINTAPVRAAIEIAGSFTIPCCTGGLAGTGYYIARKDLPDPGNAMQRQI